MKKLNSLIIIVFIFCCLSTFLCHGESQSLKVETNSNWENQIQRVLKSLYKNVYSHLHSVERDLENCQRTLLKETGFLVPGYPAIKDDITVSSYFGKTYVYFNSLQLNWMQANIKCKTHGMLLTDFDSREEFIFLCNLMKNKDSVNEYRAWIAASDLLNEGNFTWLDTGKPFSSFFTAENVPHQPDNHSGVEHCVELRKWSTGTGFKYFINDFNCEHLSYVICMHK